MEKKEDNYKNIGFRCGLEIHQQLETKKLFCDCPSLVNDTSKPDIIVTRKLRAVVGETGKVDIAAEHEMKKDKTFVYESCSTSSCLVELDEEPPHELNKEALDIAVQISLMLNARVVDEINIMRKTVIDGSNTTGFQRTALIAMNGFIETKHGKVRIPTICLEEEAAKRITEDENSVTFRLDRLGVPLIEIATETDIVSPEHCRETAEKIGLILRSLNVKRGIGTIRQDVNISIKGGARTEIKGFQDLKSIPKVIEKEIERQTKLIKEGKNLKEEVRKAEPNFMTKFLRPIPGAARMYPETDVMPIKPSLETKKIVSIHEKIAKYEELGLTEDVAKDIAKEKPDLFEKCVEKFKSINPAFIAATLISTVKEIRREGIDVENLNDENFIDIFSYIDEGKVSKDAIKDVLIDFAQNKFDIAKYQSVDEKELEKEIKKIIADKPGLSASAYMGLVMAKFKGKIDGNKAMQMLKKIVK